MKNRSNGSRIFMTELMFAILFFIIIAAVCTQCFAQAFIKSKQAEIKTEAVHLVSNAAEDFYAGKYGLEGFTFYYDQDFNQVSYDGKYQMSGTVTEANDMTNYWTMSISIKNLDTEEEIYAVNVEKIVSASED